MLSISSPIHPCGKNTEKPLSSANGVGTELATAAAWTKVVILIMIRSAESETIERASINQCANASE